MYPRLEPIAANRNKRTVQVFEFFIANFPSIYASTFFQERHGVYHGTLKNGRTFLKDFVPHLQCSNRLCGRVTQAFSLGFNMAGFQPWSLFAIGEHRRFLGLNRTVEILVFGSVVAGIAFLSFAFSWGE
jgi:hypothetical protein